MIRKKICVLCQVASSYAMSYYILKLKNVKECLFQVIVLLTKVSYVCILTHEDVSDGGLSVIKPS